METAKQIIAFYGSEVALPPDYEEYYEERAIRYSQLGLAAYELATEIRQAYGIPKRDYGAIHPKDRFEKEIKKVNDGSRGNVKAKVGEDTVMMDNGV